MNSNPPSNLLPIPSNPVPSNPLIPPGDWNTPLGLEPSGVSNGRKGVLGIDPGFGGALAWLDFGGALRVEDMPVLTIERNGKTKREIDLAELVAQIETQLPACAVVEAVGAMPGQGVSSMFAFGKGFGALLGVLAALRVPVELIRPDAWKKAARVPAGKDGARLRASQLLPAHSGHWRRTKDDGRAEAAMLAWYGLAFLADRPAFARKPGQESQGMSFRARAAISPEAISSPPKPDCGGGTPKTYERKTA